MVITSAKEVAPKIESNYEHACELKAYDETKSGVMGLLESGIQNVLQIFIHPTTRYFRQHHQCQNIHFTVPTIDLESIDKEVIDKFRYASETYGFFQVVNHGIQEMLIGVRSFNEQEAEAKKQFYTRDLTRKVV
ncbi:hypothetical protein LguiA_031072 [Lonicera macranthoides]